MQLQDAVNHGNTFLEEANKFEAENKKLKAENKQAKIDVLNELKEKYGMYYLGAYCVKYRMLSDVLNQMIEEV